MGWSFDCYNKSSQQGTVMNNEQLTEMSARVFSAVCRRDITNYTRNETQEAFRAEALALGVENKTPNMGSVVTRCMAKAGFGS